MPFRSRAQQRFMFAQHPGIAHRWADEMKGGRRASRFQREHPIKAAGLPNRVRKVWVNPSEGTASSRRALRAAATAVEESTFRRAKPKTRLTTLRKPKTYNLGSVDKSIDPELPLVPSYAGRANYRTGTAGVGKRMSGAVEGVGRPKRVQPPRNPARNTPGAGMPTMPLIQPHPDPTKPPIHPSLVGKRARRYDPEDRRQRRVGAASATLIGGGAGLTAWGGHGAYQSTRNLRAAGEHLRHLNEPGAEIRFQAKHQATDKAKGEVKGRVKYNRVADAKETAAISALSAKKNRPLVIGSRHAGRIAGGLAAIGAGGALAHRNRSRANRRWN